MGHGPLGFKLCIHVTKYCVLLFTDNYAVVITDDNQFIDIKNDVNFSKYFRSS